MKISKIKLGLLFLAASLSGSDKCFCQQQIDASPLIKFLQTNADSTIIFFYPASPPWVRSTDQLIVSKVKNEIVYSTYISPYKSYSLAHNQPTDSIGKKFAREEQIFEKTIPDTNQYFHPKDVQFKLRNRYWNEIIQLNPWQLNDSIEKAIRNKCWVYDAGGICLLLITKTAIKKPYFYDPWDFERCLPGNINRQKILKIEKIFKEIFN